MDWKEKRKKTGIRRLGFSFVYAARGLYYVYKHEQNMKIHVFLTLFIVLLAISLDVGLLQIGMLVIVIGGVITLEMVNTAIERVVDLVSPTYHPLAKTAKDVAAAAVLIYSMIAVIVGIIVFYEPVMNLFL
ncbi:LOW QUALITY PROTEIN: diacylglycerol kinase [Geomicrobium sp. JCM 19037]|nr:LOW QUALITY PROTEIN: diacylglycerol kinase [Geomicrobium sp. JCM 19037]